MCHGRGRAATPFDALIFSCGGDDKSTVRVMERVRSQNGKSMTGNSIVVWIFEFEKKQNPPYFGIGFEVPLI